MLLKELSAELGQILICQTPVKTIAPSLKLVQVGEKIIGTLSSPVSIGLCLLLDRVLALEMDYMNANDLNVRNIVQMKSKSWNIIRDLVLIQRFRKSIQDFSCFYVGLEVPGSIGTLNTLRQGWHLVVADADQKVDKVDLVLLTELEEAVARPGVPKDPSAN